ncbi:hypothetical protein CIK65_18815 [Brevibacterium aurantiacum]|uniref:Uncharacterized protein n=1 Tax=Brevibacterium aurantiacum TaxID=273384 RepID=A0A2A3YN69_BREAU|nr:hypothetical protein CIK65_18815 [Brevibacterium aurantiacum]
MTVCRRQFIDLNRSESELPATHRYEAGTALAADRSLTPSALAKVDILTAVSSCSAAAIDPPTIPAPA